MGIKTDISKYALAKVGQKFAKDYNFPELEQKFKDVSNNTTTSKVIKGGKITAIGGASLWTGDKIVDLIKEPQVNEEDLVKPIIKYRHKAVASIAPQVITMYLLLVELLLLD